MSTHCAIGKKVEGGYKYIYVHNDGYESYMFNLLIKHYNNDEIVDKLISLGDASFLAERLEPVTTYHSFEHPEPYVSVFYHRDRGESWARNEAKIDSLSYLKAAFYYTYIWDGKHWQIIYGDSPTLVQKPAI